MTQTPKPPVAPTPDKPVVHPGPGSGAGARLRNYFLTGLVVAGPLAITAWLTWSFVTWVDALVRPLVPIQYRPETYLPWVIPGSGLIIAFVALTMLGFLTANLVGRTLVEFGERLLDRMPLVRSLYKGLKQVFETLFSETGSSFRKVGLVEFPSPGMWSLVFLSASPGQQVSDRLPSREEHVSAFMPCTPNPTTGFFFYVPRSKLIELDMTVESAAKLIMSAGMIQPNGNDGQKKLAALAAAAQMAQVAQAAQATQAAETGVGAADAPATGSGKATVAAG
ncbi:DUF502 domain-containing protein [Rhodoplanes roseus]|uniref:DUF502 domain-containing protein n=1 Tax=Rhodoplanes roseus TaxID=29409 RepID=A0A327KWI8_9BRAD|nr:DUF502 domain-containing protein [Rhodoplanes roseus]RAI42671.1 hypothetical protein CH341_18305 [Rhodoplanes roseus]